MGLEADLITLYELHWSHYCEKIRLALDYMQLPWRTVDINAFGKKELRQHPLPAHLPNRIVPAILDDSTQQFVMDSTPILRYLADAYPDAPQLFPGDAANRAAIDAQLLEFDTCIGIPARRVGYSQVIFECPALLADLFLPQVAKGVFCAPVVREISGRVLGVLLSKRFDFHRAEGSGLYEALELYLLQLSVRLERQKFVVGNEFSVADLALAAQLRPLTIVPFFAEHPLLKTLLARQRGVLQNHGREGESAYQLAIKAARQKRLPVRRTLRQRVDALPFIVSNGVAANDQKEVWTWGMWAMPFHFWVTLRQGKVRQLAASEFAR
jgi:glutathione S-transferase